MLSSMFSEQRLFTVTLPVELQGVVACTTRGMTYSTSFRTKADRPWQKIAERAWSLHISYGADHHAICYGTG